MIDEIMKALDDYQPMSLDEAKRRRELFDAEHGRELRDRINAHIAGYGHPPESIMVTRERFEAVEEAFQHWPLRDENGAEFVGNACFTDPMLTARGIANVLFKGVPLTYSDHA